MCGILGSINIPISNQLLDTLKHRGPDDSGLAEFNVNNNLVTLGHRRLSIVDLTKAGHQPMSSECNHYSIIFNGEIYNHEELKKKLPSNLAFNGHSDTETILYYISEFGIDAVKDLNGIFAFAYLDKQNGLLHLVRDRYGVKPLYYFFQKNELLFSSELRPIREVFDPKNDLGAVGNCLLMRYFPAPMTPLKDVFKLEPGQILTFELKFEQVNLTSKYFLHIPKNIGSRKKDQSLLVKTYGDLFVKAVERQLMSDVDLGILLSGGIDSALIAAISKNRCRRDLKAFTIGFEGNHSEVDEIENAHETAHLLGLTHFTKRCGFTDLIASFKKTAEIVEEPIGTTSIIPMYFLSQLASSHVKVVLSGQGADEPLGGYFKYKGLSLVNKARSVKFIANLIYKLEPLFHRNEHLRRLISSIGAKDKLNAYVNYNNISSIDDISELFNQSNQVLGFHEISKSKQLFYNRLQKQAPGDISIKDMFLYYDLRTSLPDDLLMYSDKITMHFGLECRVPILDNELIEFIESLHSRYKYNFHNSKIIHRSFAADYLPASIIARKKIGFNSPTENWFRANLEELLSIFNSGNIFRSIFKIEKINTILRLHAKGQNFEKQIFLLLAIYYFLENSKSNKDAIVDRFSA